MEAWGLWQGGLESVRVVAGGILWDGIAGEASYQDVH